LNGWDVFLRLQRIHYENFRNHRLLTFEPSEGITLLYGANASGKTSILEGIHYCALTRGFISATDSECLSFLTDYFILDSCFLDEQENQTSIRIVYKKEREKQLVVNNSEIKPFSRHIGRVPCITFSPSELIIVHGAPAERRRFIDNAISQTDRRYLDDLLAYRRVLQQRNALLGQLYAKVNDQKEMLSLWTENISRLAASIVYARLQFLGAFYSLFHEVYRTLSNKEDPSITYRSSIGKISNATPVDELYTRFVARYEATERDEILRGQTMTGPHRDDLLFFLNEKEIKKYASQGQLRTFLIALKLSQHRLYYETIGIKPICLLDDIFSELDATRVTDIFSMLETCGQTIITSAEIKVQQHVTSISIESLTHSMEK
jgi:DNA replication and repair protein RecF